MRDIGFTTPSTRQYSSLYRGVVESNYDPKNLGRCKVRVPSIHGELTYPVANLPWARPISMIPIHGGRGSVAVPDEGDIVWVFFEGANGEFPVYFGGTYAEGEVEVDSSKVDLYLENGNKISYDRTSGSYTINSGSCSILVTNEGISIIGETNINGNLKIQGDLSVEGNSKVSGDLSVNGSISASTLNVINLNVTGHASFSGSVSGLPED